jgi:hypothetical protein
LDIRDVVSVANGASIYAFGVDLLGGAIVEERVANSSAGLRKDGIT